MRLNLLEQALRAIVEGLLDNGPEATVFESNFIMFHVFIDGFENNYTGLSLNYDGTATIFRHKGDTQYQYDYSNEQYLKAAKNVRKWQLEQENKTSDGSLTKKIRLLLIH